MARPTRRDITIRCTRSRGPRGFFCLHDFRRGPVNVAVIQLNQMTDDNELYFCGELDHSKLALVVRLAAEAFSTTEVSIYKSQFDGSERLKIRSKTVRIDTQMGSDSLISGLPGLTASEATDYLQTFSTLLSQSRIKHRFELYDNENQLIVEFDKRHIPRNWIRWITNG